jgi:hypothetical protein
LQVTRRAKLGSLEATQTLPSSLPVSARSVIGVTHRGTSQGHEALLGSLEATQFLASWQEKLICCFFAVGSKRETRVLERRELARAAFRKLT